MFFQQQAAEARSARTEFCRSRGLGSFRSILAPICFCLMERWQQQQQLFAESRAERCRSCGASKVPGLAERLHHSVHGRRLPQQLERRHYKHATSWVCLTDSPVRPRPTNHPHSRSTRSLTPAAETIRACPCTGV